jgi:hypothetical protein
MAVDRSGGHQRWHSLGSRAVKLFRRILAVLVMAGATAAGIRLKGSGGVPPQHGGWRPLRLPSEEG